MPIFEFQGPDGSVYEIEAADERSAVSAFQRYAPSESQQSQDLRSDLSAMTQNPRVMIPSAQEDKGVFNAATQGSKAGVFFGFDDELGAGIRAPIAAAQEWWRGNGFDVGDQYTRIQQQLQAEKDARREQHPIASIVGEVAGGLALGGKAAQSGLTLAGKTVPGLSKVMPRTAAVLPAAAEGAAYGGLYGAGEAKPGERLSGAATGAAIGGLMGGAVQGVSNALATRSAQKAANTGAPSADEFAAKSHKLYKAAEMEGVKFKKPSIERLGQQLKAVAGQPNQHLRPTTTGYLDEISTTFNREMTLEALDEFRSGLNAELKRAKPADAQRLLLMKQQVDKFADNATPSVLTGDIGRANAFLKGARESWAQKAKLETIDRIMDQASVDGAGKYTQSGVANAIRREMNGLYKNIKRGKAPGWSKEEVALIRQMASGGSNSKVINLFAKLAPRGAVSFMAGQMAGSLVPGAGNVIVPLAGEVAARSADRAAMSAAQRLATGVATGAAPVGPQVARKTTPLISGGTAGILELLRQPQTPQGLLPR